MNPVFDRFLRGHAGPVGVAVSGGGDSVALLVLLAETGAELRAVTVDHGLRAGSAQEAAGVADLCRRLGVPHETLTWDGAVTGNLQADARAARYRLIGDWAARCDVGAVALGHTLDDQAETVLLRLRRGSGVDGLAAMAAQTRRDGVTWWRPLLGIRREELRAVLRGRGVAWVDDPSNDDDRFDRVKVRRAMAVLEDLGLPPESLAATADRLGRAREVLESDTLALARAAARVRPCGTVRLNRRLLAEAAAEIRYRLLAHALMWVASAPYRPRMASLMAAWQAASGGAAQTLHGCLIQPSGADEIEIIREIAAMPVIPATQTFDTRWLTGPAPGQVRALGPQGLSHCPDWRETGDSRAALTASPSLWRDGELISAPFARRDGAWTCRLIRGTEDFFSSILTH